MEVSQPILVNYPASAAPDGNHIAAVNNARLEIRSPLHLTRTINIPSQPWSIRWSTNSARILVFDDEHVRVFDLYDEKWTATISNGSGGMGKIANVAFGRTTDEVLVFSEFGSKVTVWNLQTRRTVEIRDPKFATKCFGHRSAGGSFALLSRSGAQDVLTIHAPNTYALLRTAVLPTTDAQGLKWSPDGRWIVVWEAPSMGYRVHVYTADGHLYRTYNGPSSDGIQGLGVKSVEWSPRGDYLAIGGHDRRVTLLSARTFSPTMMLDHTSTIQLAQNNIVWEEQVSASSQRSYTAVAQPVSPPTASPAPSDQAAKIGLSMLSFNADGTMLVSRDDSVPTAVWIWNLAKLTTQAVIIQHSPVKQISWHPTSPSLLLVQSMHEEAFVYIYDAMAGMPFAMQLPIKKTAGKFDARWLNTAADKKPAILFGDSGNFIVAWPDGKDVIVRFDDQEESEDSLFEVLTGRKSPSKAKYDSTEVLVSDVLDEPTEDLDDTFMGRGKLAGTRRFSGEDEMF